MVSSRTSPTDEMISCNLRYGFDQSIQGDQVILISVYLEEIDNVGSGVGQGVNDVGGEIGRVVADFGGRIRRTLKKKLVSKLMNI